METMAESHEFGALTRAFSGLGIGVDEKSLISILGSWEPEQRKSFRQGVREFFEEDERLFERWNHSHIAKLEREFLRLKNATVLWTMHPWERDARLANESVTKGTSQSVLIEIACSRSSDELLGARKAYHSIFAHSIEEDVAAYVSGTERKLLVALVSSYRYEGPKVNEEIAKSEAKIIYDVVKDEVKFPAQDEEVGRIFTTRSNLHIKSIAKHYKEISGTNIDEDLSLDSDVSLKQTVQCLCTPEVYFSTVLGRALENGADDDEGLSRVIVSRADVDMNKIKEEFNRNFGADLADKIQDSVNGNYRDFLLTLIARGD